MEINVQPVPGNGFPNALPSSKWEETMRAGLERALYEVGDAWKNDSIANAPKSPSVTILKRLSKKESFKTKETKRRKSVTVSITDSYARSAKSLSRKDGSGARAYKANPGGLERSIQMEYDDEHCEVFVTSNAEAGSYAERIHDEKGVSWSERGPGTQAKGAQADDKFIERAINGKLEVLAGKLEKVVAKVFRQ